MPYRAIAVVTALALLAWTLGLPAWIHSAQAATFSQISDTLSDSDLGVDSAHRIQFTTTNGMTGGQNLRISFDPTTTAFDLSSLTVNDVYVVQGATKVDAVGDCSGSAGEMYATINAETIDFTMCAGDTVASSTTMILDVGTTTGGNLIANPATAGSYVIQIGGDAASTAQDSGDTRVAIIDDVTVTASVDTIFTFSINAVDEGVTVNDDTDTDTTGTSTATSVPFGTVAPNTDYLMAQELRVSTNALNGFSVTVEADQTLTAGNNATIDEFIDGTGVSSSTLWTSPGGTLGNTDEYGHWGVTSDDNVVSGADPDLWGNGEAAYRGDFVQNPIEVFYNNTPVEYSQGGQGVGSTTVGYRLEITNLQEAAKDYTATLTYIATPVF